MPTWKTMSKSCALWLWSEVFRLASDWNGTTVLDLEHQLIARRHEPIKMRQIRELAEAMIDEGRLAVTAAGVLSVSTDVSRWEEYAALFADSLLAGGDPLLLVNQADNEPYDFMVCWWESIAFLEGFAGMPRPSIKAVVAYNAGILAKTLLDERRKTETRIWEALSTRRWKTAVAIAEAIGWLPTWDQPVRYHLFRMNRQREVEMRKHRGRLEYRLVRR